MIPHLLKKDLSQGKTLGQYPFPIKNFPTVVSLPKALGKLFPYSLLGISLGFQHWGNKWILVVLGGGHDRKPSRLIPAINRDGHFFLTEKVRKAAL